MAGIKSTYLIRGLCALLCALAFGLAVPPFQVPDEPHHFAAAMIYARGEENRDTIERETIEFMDKYDWWTLAGMGRPAVLPQRISGIRFLMAGSPSGDFRDRIERYDLYHKIMGRLLRIIGSKSLPADYYFARFFSIMFFSGGLIFLGLALKTISKAGDVFSASVFLLVAFLPQLVFMGVGAAPDGLVFLLGSVFFWGALSLIGGQGKSYHVLALVACSGLGLLMDRSAFVFIFLAVLVPLFMMRRGKADKIIPGALMGLVGIILLLYFISLKFPSQIENAYLALKYVFGTMRKTVPALLSLSLFERNFWLQFVDSAFLRFGWMHFGPPSAVVWIWRIVCAGAGAGLFLGFLSFIKRRMSGFAVTGSSKTRRRLLLFSAVAVFAQCLGLWAYYGSAGIFAQGRYIFPVLPAVGLVIAMGIENLGRAMRPKSDRILVLGIGLFEIFVLVYSLWAIVIPIFRLTIRSPYPGI